MSTNFRINSIDIKNYRCFKSLKIDKLSRINIISGENGAGKTTLLDAIFLAIDRKNAMAFNRPFIAKNLNMPYPNGLNYIFSDKNSNEAKIEFGTRSGRLIFTIKKSPKDANFSSVSNFGHSPLNAGNQLDSNTIQLIAQYKNNNSPSIQSDTTSTFTQISPIEISANIVQKSPIPELSFNAAYLSIALPVNPTENAERYSLAKKNKQIGDIIDVLKIITPHLVDLQLYFESPQPVIYAVLDNGEEIQSSMMGGGFSMILSVLLTMSTAVNGIVLLDEIDGSIHYSKLSDFWLSISKFSHKYNCQVFAITHSIECIKYAISGLNKTNHSKDLSYFRIENNNDSTYAVEYSSSELIDALNSSWEIR